MWWVCHVMIHPSLTRRKMIGGDRDPWVETHGKIHLPLRGKNSVG
jgi:hypothetical protein